MTSINTNIAAQTALRTLQSTNTQLDTTQSRISTGLKIGEAKDNAAYWSISTSLQSDNKAMGTVKDALGLGAATVDTAYQGLNAAKDVLDEIKSKLTAATQSGVDRNVIQSEIAELQKQLQSIAGSSIFSGENWLSINSEAAGFASNKEVVASFTRDANNAVTIGTVGIDISNVALFDASTVAGKNGILDGAISLKGADGRDLDLGTENIEGNIVAAGVVDGTDSGAVATALTGTPGTAAATNSTLTFGTFDATDIDVGDTITFDLTGGSATSATPVTISLAAVTDAASLRTAITSALSTASITGVTVGGTGEAITLTATTAITVANLATVDTDSNSTTTADLGLADGSVAAPAAASEGELTTGEVDTAGLLTGDTLTFSMVVDGDVEQRTITLTSDAPSVSALAGLLNTAFVGVATVAEGPSSDGTLVFTSATNGVDSSVVLSSVLVKNADGVTQNGDIGLPLIEAGSVSTDTFSAITLDADDNLYFKIQVDDATGATNVTIDQKLIDEALADVADRESGEIATVAQFKTVMEAALKAANVNGVTVSAGTNNLVFTSNTTGEDSKIVISDVNASAGADTVSIMDIDISEAGLAEMSANSGEDVKALLSAYVSAVSQTITKVTEAASNLGAVASRIELQQSFVSNLMDTIDAGVSGLIDADMNEESTRLQALQVKQQLGVQALSIANQSAQNVLRLFQ